MSQSQGQLPHWLEVLLMPWGWKVFEEGWQVFISSERAWPDRTKEPRPEWMHKSDFIPSDCYKFCFCINNLTTGIQHKTRKVTKTVFIQHDNSRTVQKGCTTKRVNLQRSGHIRKLCASEDEEIQAMNSKTKKKLCNTSKFIVWWSHL